MEWSGVRGVIEWRLQDRREERVAVTEVGGRRLT